MAGGVVAPHAGSVDRNPCRCGPHKTCERSLPTRGAWIEIRKSHDTILRLLSLPTRGAWIEIRQAYSNYETGKVAPHAGSVDRNIAADAAGADTGKSLPTRGAWIEINHRRRPMNRRRSLPTRGAWIEIPLTLFFVGRIHVAPHAGSVDRNGKAEFDESLKNLVEEMKQNGLLGER